MACRAGRSLEENSFTKIQHTSCCLFAAASVVEVDSAWDSELSFGENSRAAAKRLEAFCERSRHEHFDGYVLEVKGGLGRTLPGLCRVIRELLWQFSECDPFGAMCMRADLRSTTWRFQFAGVVFYLVVFAPCYGPDHPRSSLGDEGLFVLFQPAAAFARRHPQGANCLPESTRRAISDAFESAGKPYDRSISLGPLEAYRVVKPLKLGDDPVNWWIVDSHADPQPATPYVDGLKSGLK